jgi:hypothetical protein
LAQRALPASDGLPVRRGRYGRPNSGAVAASVALSVVSLAQGVYLERRIFHQSAIVYLARLYVAGPDAKAQINPISLSRHVPGSLFTCLPGPSALHPGPGPDQDAGRRMHLRCTCARSRAKDHLDTAVPDNLGSCASSYRHTRCCAYFCASAMGWLQCDEGSGLGATVVFASLMTSGDDARESCSHPSDLTADRVTNW